MTTPFHPDDEQCVVSLMESSPCDGKAIPVIIMATLYDTSTWSLTIFNHKLFGTHMLDGIKHATYLYVCPQHAQHMLGDGYDYLARARAAFSNDKLDHIALPSSPL